MAQLTCGYKLIQILVGIFNLLAFICGLIFIIIGAVVYKWSPPDFDPGFPLKAPAIIAIIFGSVILILGFLGCCGAFKEVPCMLITFSIIMSMIFIILFAAGIASFVGANKLDGDKIEKYLRTLFDKRSEKVIAEILDGIYEIFECCGVKGPGDYSSGAPKSCKQFTAGCQVAIASKLPKYLSNVGIAIFVLLIILLLSILMSSCLAARIRQGNTM